MSLYKGRAGEGREERRGGTALPKYHKQKRTTPKGSFISTGLGGGAILEKLTGLFWFPMLEVGEGRHDCHGLMASGGDPGMILRGGGGEVWPAVA